MSEFEKDWSAEVLYGPPMIAPARSFVYPHAVAGEEDAMGRGALYLMVKPAAGGSFLATCALGFKDRAMPTGVFACPRVSEMCAVAGGYAYVIDTAAPERCVFLTMRPVVEVRTAESLLLFVGFHTILAWGRDGLAWETGKLSWEGVRVSAIDKGFVRGFGWDVKTDKEVEFSVDLGNGAHVGGGYSP